MSNLNNEYSRVDTALDIANYYKLLGYKYYPTKLKQQREFSLDEKN